MSITKPWSVNLIVCMLIVVTTIQSYECHQETTMERIRQELKLQGQAKTKEMLALLRKINTNMMEIKAQLDYIRPGYSNSIIKESIPITKAKASLNPESPIEFKCHAQRQDAICNTNEEISPVYHDVKATPTCYACLPPGLGFTMQKNVESGAATFTLSTLTPAVTPVVSTTTTEDHEEICLEPEQLSCQSGYIAVYRPDLDCWSCRLAHDEPRKRATQGLNGDFGTSLAKCPKISCPSVSPRRCRIVRDDDDCKKCICDGELEQYYHAADTAELLEVEHVGSE